MKEQQMETKCIQSGYQAKNGAPKVLPIYQSTTFQFDSATQLGDLFDLKSTGHMYTRISNPTTSYVAEKIAALEGGVGALLTASGQAALLMAVLNITASGQNFVCLSSVYGGSINLFAVTMKRMGIEVRFITDEMEDDEIDALFDENTRLLFSETLSNPALSVLDIERFAKLAHKHQVPLVVDNTFATPVLCRPITFGADIVVHSTTKYMDGHASVVGGAVVDSGNFDWQAAGKYPELTEADASYHGVVYTESFGRAAYLNKACCQLMRDLGASPQPLAAFILDLGLSTLALRMERHSANAHQVAQYLKQHPQISYVNYPGLMSSPQHDLAEKYLPRGASGVVSFGIKGGRRSAVQFMDALRLAAICVHVASVQTMVLHPASTTHRQLSETQLFDAGVSPDMVRMSIGIEHVDDIIADIRQALAQSQEGGSYPCR